MDAEILMTVAEVAQLANVSTLTVRARVKSRDLIPYTCENGRLLFRRADYDAWTARALAYWAEREAQQQAYRAAMQARDVELADRALARQEATATRQIERMAREEVRRQAKRQAGYMIGPPKAPRVLHPKSLRYLRTLRGLEWQARRAEVIARDGLICQLCHQAVRADDVDIDHIIPRSQGGSDDLDNLRVAHSFCNRSRGAARANYTPISYFNPILLNPERRKRKKKEQFK